MKRAESTRMRVGVYGGSFDPPHVAHVLLVSYAFAVGRFDRILVVPVFAHAFAKSLAPFEHRLRLCEIAFADFSRLSVSSVEARLPTPSRTFSTLEAISAEYPGAELRLIIGADVLAESSKWHAFEAVARIAPPFVVGRAGHGSASETHFALPAVSSTRVRELCAERDDARASDELSAIVPAGVLEYIEQNGLYRAERNAPSNVR